MKLVYLLTTGGGRAGTEKAIADQTNAMSALGHDVTMVSVYRSDDDPFDFGPSTAVTYLTDLHGADGTPSAVVPAEWDNQFCPEADRALLGYLGSVDADFVIASTPALMQYALLAVPDGVKVVGEDHRATMSRGILAEPIMRHGPRADAVVALTEWNAEWLREAWGSEAPRVEAIPNALPPTGRPLSGGEQKVIMAAGRLVPSKGFVDLIRAFAAVADEFPDWRLRIFGKGPQAGRLHTLVRDYGLDDRVELMPPSRELDREWARASIGALTSKTEGLSLVLLEALAAGIPVVSYDCPAGPREIVDHGENGYLVPLGDVRGFADCLRLLMGDDERRVRMAAHAPHSLARYSQERVTGLWKELFEELAGEPGTRRQRLLEAARAETADDAPEERSPEEHEEQSSAEAVDAPEEIAEPLIVPVLATREELAPEFAKERNRTLFRELFADTGIRCRPLRQSRTKFSWAVPIEDREGVIDAFRGADIQGLEVRLYARGARLDTDGVSWRGEDGIDPSDVTRLLAYVHYAGQGADEGRGVGYAGGLLVEFWDRDAARPLLYRGAGRNLEADLLREDQFDRPLFADWEALCSRPLWTRVDFPIDAVYTWVDGTDPAWSAKRARAAGDGADPIGDGADDTDLASGAMRFRNRDELRYSLRSLRANAPWIRNIFLVTDDQRPHWLLDGQGVTLVDHRDIFPDPDALPVFNSHAIEASLHRIPGLAERFIYLNDDGFFMRPQDPDQYFTPTGQAKFFPSPTKINDLGDLAEPHEQAGMNNRALIEAEFGVTPTQAMLHAPYPHRVSHLAELETRHAEAFDRTRRARFRSATDISLLSSLAQYWGHFTGRYQTGALRVAFVGLGAPNASRSLAAARTATIDYLTFGEAAEYEDPEYTQEMATTFMARQFPLPAPWEAPEEPGASDEQAREGEAQQEDLEVPEDL